MKRSGMKLVGTSDFDCKMQESKDDELTRITLVQNNIFDRVQ